MTTAKLRLARAAMGQPETKVGDLCAELGITRQTLYRFVSQRANCGTTARGYWNGGRPLADDLGASRAIGLPLLALPVLTFPMVPAGYLLKHVKPPPDCWLALLLSKFVALQAA